MLNAILNWNNLLKSTGMPVTWSTVMYQGNLSYHFWTITQLTPASEILLEHHTVLLINGRQLRSQFIGKLLDD